MKLSEKVNFSIALTAVPAQSAGFSVPGLIVDAPEVPIYQRIRAVTRSDYATILDTTTTAAAWAAKLWFGSASNVATAYVIRWAATAQPSRFVCEDVGTTLATWTAVTAGDFGVSIGGVPTVLVTTGTFAGCTDMDDVAAVIETAVQALAGDWATCTVTIDPLGYLVLANSATGDDADEVSFTAPTGGEGTDISGAGFLNITSGAYAVAGMDAEDPDDALAASLEIEDEIRIIHEIGASIAQQTSLATACAAYGKIWILNVRDEDAKDSTSTTDIAYILNAASNSYVRGVYTEHAGDYPSATENGQRLTRPEGSASFANKALSGVNESGLDPDGTTVIPLTPTERAALDDKNCDYIVNWSSSNMCNHGLTFAGIEMKHRVGYSWAELRSAEEIGAYLQLNEVTFSDTDIQAICGIIFKWVDILVDRKCSSSYTINIPSAADISLIEQATHTLTLSDVAAIISAYAINQVVAAATATA
jgi:hypothetical protein